MTSTAHALVAGAIASRFSDPVITSILAVCSHYIMDSIPHWDFGTNWRERPKALTGVVAITDTVFGIWLSYMVFGKTLPFSLWAIAVAFSLLPDWLETPWYIFYAHNKKHGPSKKASVIEKTAYALYKAPNIFHSKAQLPLGIVTQVITVIFFMVILK